jgi:hypothetical protein
MAKYAAFGATLAMGTRQVETATVVGTITGAGNATFTVTAAGMGGTPKDVIVAVLLNDTADTVAEKTRAAMILDADVIAWFEVGGSGSQVVLTRRVAAADDATMNIAYTNTTCAGLTPDAVSDDTVAGVDYSDIVYIKSIGGPGLSIDTEDVTTHDSEDAWEEVVATILRTGEISLDLVYDPNAATHSAAAGLLDYYENAKLGYFDCELLATYHWLFPAYVTKFEPTTPVGGSLTASATLKITGKPIIV